MLKACLAPQIVLTPNLFSLYELGGARAAQMQVADMVANDWIGVFADIPSVPLRVISRGEVAKNGTDELRGIVDQGQPRKPLSTVDGEPVEALNPKTKLADWSHEDKDTLENAAFNGCIVDALLRLDRDPAFTDEMMIAASGAKSATLGCAHVRRPAPRETPRAAPAVVVSHVVRAC